LIVGLDFSSPILIKNPPLFINKIMLAKNNYDIKKFKEELVFQAPHKSHHP
jgi:hypothetical protein